MKTLEEKNIDEITIEDIKNMKGWGIYPEGETPYCCNNCMQVFTEKYKTSNFCSIECLIDFANKKYPKKLSIWKIIKKSIYK